jgi:hypothetical protein
MPVAGSSLDAGGDVRQTDSLPSLARSGDRCRWPSAAPVGVDSGKPQTIPWWLWWNVLSADAPIVALVWAALFAPASGGRLAAADATVLVLAVWIVYVSDRLLDGWTAKSLATLQERHRFCDRHRFALFGLVVVASATMVWLIAHRLPTQEVGAGAKLGIILILYMAAIHAGSRRVARLLPKEIVVGFLFASGVTLPGWSQSVRFRWDVFLPWTLLALLCSLNCLSIEFWENDGRGSIEMRPAFVRGAAAHINGIAAALATIALLACLVSARGAPSVSGLLAVCVGALLILVLNQSRSRLSPAALRVLADAALVVPPLFAVGIRGSLA